MAQTDVRPDVSARLTAWYRRNREITAQLFAIPVPEDYLARPIPLRHPIEFYEGHLPAFSYITLNRGALGQPPIDEHFEKFFQRGIDPDDLKTAQAQSVTEWPTREEVRRLASLWDAAVISALDDITRQGHKAPALSRQGAYTILEHEPMHHETFLYMLHRLPVAEKRRPAGAQKPRDGEVPAGKRIAIPAGKATLGARSSDVVFGWDNEFEETRVDVPAFEIDAHSVTNADWLKFVDAGGEPAPFWVRRGDEWHQSAMFDEIPLPLAWPAYVTQEQATAYARWQGRRLPSEGEYHRAAYGTAGGEERPQPWGDAAPDSTRGNFGLERYDPVPAGSYPAGASAWGVHDLVGNGWEWTSTVFGPLPGFAPMKTYPPYSSDFFDGQHYVMKGASAVTARELIRRSLRNWFRPNYPYVYAKFRTVN
ncbi:MAG TPA: SUMF1/EgtB/PvdO family nonheme iron enzyme [Candidatus Tumulicola sp.]|nr:SUMF1/EgtB/PvdO family nonheme iron enzyme [Candidatus Tumulicola sp.]